MTPTPSTPNPETLLAEFDPNDQYVHYRNLINGFPDVILRDYLERAITEAFQRGRYSSIAYPASEFV